MRTSKGQSTQKEKSYENICCFSLQSWARERRIRCATRRKQTEEKAAANGAARASVLDRTCDRRWSRPKENVNGGLSGAEGQERSDLSGSLSGAQGQQGANPSGRLPGAERQEGPRLNGSLSGAERKKRPDLSRSLS